MKSVSPIVGKLATPSARRNECASPPHLVRIAPFFGFGTSHRIVLQGRVVENEGLIPSELANTPWKNLGNLYRRFGADEMPGVRVRAAWGDLQVETRSDVDGYFRFDFHPPNRSETEWHDLALSLPEICDPTGAAVKASGTVLLPRQDAQFGIISDLDDTVLKTNVANRLRMLITVALRNARERIAFPGVAAFYRALQRGRTLTERNPLFYVSTCPWNFFDLLTEFFRIHEIPLGPMLLKDYRLWTLLFHRDAAKHKLSCIRTLLQFYPALPFILIGDSGEHDPEIYAEIVRAHPGRIRVIYIRDLAISRWRSEAIDRVQRELEREGCEVVLTRDSEDAAVHASAMGLIHPEALDEIRWNSHAEHVRSA